MFSLKTGNKDSVYAKRKKLLYSKDSLHMQPIYFNPHKSRAEDKYGRATKLNGT